MITRELCELLKKENITDLVYYKNFVSVFQFPEPEFMIQGCGGNGYRVIYGFDGSYVGMEEEKFNILEENDITPQRISESEKVASIGFSPRQQKWFGWSHRAIFGFGVGSSVKRGDIAYHSKDEEDFLNYMVEFWYDEGYRKTWGEFETNGKEKGVRIYWIYSDESPNMHGSITSVFSEFPDTWGRGEWTAKNIDDAKQMAIDFAKSIS